MKIARLALAALLSTQLCLPLLAGESWQLFSSMELGLAFLDPKGLTESADENLDSLFNLTGDLIGGNLSAAKPLGDGIQKLREQIIGVARGQSSALHPYLEPYQVLEQTPMRFEQIDLPNKQELRILVISSNEVLKKIYRVSETVKLSEALLPQLQTDIGKLNRQDPLQKASLGIVAVSLANLNLGAGQSANELRTQLASLQQQVESKLRSTQSAVASNPMNAMSMGEDIQVLTSLTATLARASGALADAGKKLPGVLGSLQGIIGELT